MDPLAESTCFSNASVNKGPCPVFLWLLTSLAFCPVDLSKIKFPTIFSYSFSSQPSTLNTSELCVFSGRVRGGRRPAQREFLIDNLLVRNHFIIVTIRWAGLAPWGFEFTFPGSLTSTFLKGSLTATFLKGCLTSTFLKGSLTSTFVSRQGLRRQTACASSGVPLNP